MDKLGLIIKTEYLTDVKAKSFWLSTILVPLFLVLFSVVVAFLMSQSDSLETVASFAGGSSIGKEDDLSAPQVAGMMVGMCLCFVIMSYGSMIFTKVKAEKTNRIVEIMATCVTGRTMMLAKLIAVGLEGLTQLCLWGLLIGVFASGAILVFMPSMSFHWLMSPFLWKSLIWTVLYFVGGYVFFGSMYAACGAMSDKNNENQEYMTILTFVLLFSFYLGVFAVDNGDAALSRFMAIFPFTSPTVGAVGAISGSSSLLMTLISILVLFLCAAGMLVLSGKIYTSSLLLKGKRFSPKDILTFLRSK